MKNILILILSFCSFNMMAQYTCENCPEDDYEIIWQLGGGTGTITYTVGAQSNTTGIFIVSDPGTYTVVGTDANGCTRDTTFVFTDLVPIPLTCRWNTQNGSFINNCIVQFCDDGQYIVLDVQPNGQTFNCTVTSPSNVVYIASPTGSVLIQNGIQEVGIWTYNCTDSNGCDNSVDFEFVLGDCCDLTVSCTNTDLDCFGDSDATATATPSGAIGNITYLWDDPAAQTTATAAGLSTGTYTVTVTDDGAANCTATCSVTIIEPSLLVAACTGTNVLCNGDTDGTATVTASGGTAGYTYLWDDAAAQTTATATVLPAGTYTVIVTDANGCTQTCSYAVIEPTPLTITNAGCN